MRIGILLRATRRTFMLSSMIAACAGCNAVVDFGGKFGSDGPKRDSGVADSGPGKPEGDSGPITPDKDSGATPIEDSSTPADTGTIDAAITDGGSDAAAMNGNDAMMTCSSQTEDCSNDDDDDCDGLEDCADPDCSAAPVCCRPNQIPEVSCSGGIDNDCDSEIDCLDSDCATSPLCCTASGAEVGGLACSDSRDNDCDGLVDCAETSCAAQAACCDASGDENTAAVCGDGLDNDCDAKKDCADPDCALTAACCIPTGLSETSCNDNVDNDCNGLVDCQDAQCATTLPCVTCAPDATSEVDLCKDGADNDCDRDRDCRDADCAEATVCCVDNRPLGAPTTENSADTCIDEDDNDCDGLVDCEDPDCGGDLSCCVVAAENTSATCFDGLDNDCDMRLDCADDSCQGTMACCVHSGAENSLAACTDNVDNDCDGKLNCTDPDCAGISTCCGVTSSEVTSFAVGCCTPDGMAEAAAPNDGRDNDCDGLVDIPILISAFPVQGLPSSGDQVNLRFMTEIDVNATLQCRTRKQSDTLIPPWSACPMSGMTIRPFTADASKPENDGAWITEARWAFPLRGAYSDVHTFKYYVHHTLRNVSHCVSAHSDAQWFAKAATRLSTPDASKFRLGLDTFLASPFIRVAYKTPLSNVERFELDGSLQTLDMWSLRRRFSLSSDQRFLLVTRNFKSTRSGSCSAGGLRIHNTQRGGNQRRFNTYGCDAIVLNRAGAGVCMNAGSPDPVFPVNTDQNDFYANHITGSSTSVTWDKANKFMWRIFMAPDKSGRANFTRKCDTASCSGIYLPDRGLFAP